MEFGIKKWGVVVMKTGKLSKADDFILPKMEVIKEVEQDGHKFKEMEIKDPFKREHLKAKLKVKSKLIGNVLIKEINTCPISF